jgi:hypothetical protein
LHSIALRSGQVQGSLVPHDRMMNAFDVARLNLEIDCRFRLIRATGELASDPEPMTSLSFSGSVRLRHSRASWLRGDGRWVAGDTLVSSAREYISSKGLHGPWVRSPLEFHQEHCLLPLFTLRTHTHTHPQPSPQCTDPELSSPPCPEPPSGPPG